MRATVSATFLVSGMAGLIFEVVWFHRTSLVFGNSVWADNMLWLVNLIRLVAAFSILLLPAAAIDRRSTRTSNSRSTRAVSNSL